ncbi:3-oxoacyl-ACP synthase [Aliidongia dinghuensis]|uniref:3-oxoacyl-ACP synthase n=1 Tax=Aliidongia dinghuensis TaxID=1867774 RepID=A0A8J3E443_9PROT|nr:ketoacyl-ACP synthase III [Aliidongia dinghuensis]GGF24085.1 3-oxoacyl-ACP synthase [Aliidongia dinghuensis]
MQVGIAAISYHLPETVLDNASLAAANPRFQPEKVKAKTGIDRRHVAAPDETAVDLAVAAGERLFTESGIDRTSVDHLIFCTQAPDYFLPTSACVVHGRLGLPAEAGAVDINLGCSGFVYGLGLASGLIHSGQASRVLLLTADTYSKFIDVEDLSVRSIFGDGSAATLVEAGGGSIGPFVYGTDGKGAEHLIVPTGGLRAPVDEASPDDGYIIHGGRRRAGRPLHMNGPEVFNFSIAAVPAAVRALLHKAALTMADVDLFVFHQANTTMLEALRRKLEIPVERFFVDLADAGNTVSSTIPIALRRAASQGRLQAGDRVMLVGFGVGYSWAATLLTWC